MRLGAAAVAALLRGGRARRSRGRRGSRRRVRRAQAERSRARREAALEAAGGRLGARAVRRVGWGRLLVDVNGKMGRQSCVPSVAQGRGEEGRRTAGGYVGSGAGEALWSAGAATEWSAGGGYASPPCRRKARVRQRGAGGASRAGKSGTHRSGRVLGRGPRLGGGRPGFGRRSPGLGGRRSLLCAVGSKGRNGRQVSAVRGVAWPKRANRGTHVGGRG